jgi:hypothetical protein
VQAAAIIGESIDETSAATTVMDKNRRIVQTAIYPYFCREGNEIHSGATLIQLILRSASRTRYHEWADIDGVLGMPFVTTKET